MSTPILPLAVWASGTNQNSIPANDNALRLEALSRKVVSMTTTAQPASPADGDVYILPASATGTAWSTFTAGDLAIFRSGSWYAWAPVPGIVVNVAGTQKQWSGSAWVDLTGGSSGDFMSRSADNWAPLQSIGISDAHAFARGPGYRVYFLDGAAANRPPAPSGNDGPLEVFQYNASVGYTIIRFHDWRTGRTWCQYEANSVWSPWTYNVVADANANLSLPGFTQLGESAPAIKQKMIEGTTPNSAGAWTQVAHGLDASKIVRISVVIRESSGPSWITPGVNVGGDTTSYACGVFADPTNAVVTLGPSVSSNMLSRPFRVVIDYQS